MPGTAFSAGSWTGYDERPATNPASALTDFTLLIDISRMSATWKAAIQSDGGDIRLTNGSNTELPFDLIDFAYNAGAPTGWIRVKYTGTLASSGTQNVRVWAGYTGGTAVAYSDNETYGADNAYNSGWSGYWPLEDTSERTVNAHTLTASGSPTANQTGQVGECYLFTNAARQYLTAGDVKPASVHFSAWINLSATGQNSKVASHWDGADGWILTYQTSSGKLQLFSTHGGAAVTSILSAAISTGTWYKVDAIVTNGQRQIWLNGSVSGSDTPSGALDYGTAEFFMSSLYSSVDPNNSWRGYIDDAQLHSTARSSAWIGEEYAQSNSQSTFWGTWAWTANVSGSSWYYNLQQQLACDRREEILQ